MSILHLNYTSIHFYFFDSVFYKLSVCRCVFVCMYMFVYMYVCVHVNVEARHRPDIDIRCLS